jgi:HD-GYP domain-containing protein (c-di-GMP phosphodiesterase class II)
MPRIPVTDLAPGMVLARPLYDSRGRLMLGAWEPLTPSMLRQLEAVAKNIWLGEPEAIASNTLATLAPGPGIPLVDAPAAEINERRVARRSREEQLQIARVRATIRKQADDMIAVRETRWRRLSMRIEPSSARSVAGMIGTLHAEILDTASIQAFRRDRVQVLSGIYRRLAMGEQISASTVNIIVDELLDEAHRRPRSLIMFALERNEHADALLEHALGVGILSVAITHALGWAEADKRAAACSGLLADVGVALLASNLRAVPRPLTEEETNALHRHPLFSAAALENIRTGIGEAPLDERIQLAIFQHHERENAGGYPRRTRSSEIHDLAKVVGVADVFLALIEARAHRPALTVDEALAYVVRQANAGVLGREAVRGLVMALGITQSTSPIMTPARVKTAA